MRDTARLSASALLLAVFLAAPARAVPIFSAEGGVRLSSRASTVAMKRSTNSGSNCVPAQRRSSANAASWAMPLR